MTPDQRREVVMEIVDELGAILIVDRDLVCGFVLCDGRNDPHGYAQFAKRPFAGAPTLPPLAYLSHDPGSSTEAFLVALHELGHLVKGRRGSIREHEAHAWRYALKVSGPSEQPDADLWGRIARDLRSYVTSCTRCKPSADFDRLLKQAEREASHA